MLEVDIMFITPLLQIIQSNVVIKIHLHLYLHLYIFRYIILHHPDIFLHSKWIGFVWYRLKQDSIHSKRIIHASYKVYYKTTDHRPPTGHRPPTTDPPAGAPPTHQPLTHRQVLHRSTDYRQPTHRQVLHRRTDHRLNDPITIDQEPFDLPILF